MASKLFFSALNLLIMLTACNTPSMKYESFEDYPVYHGMDLGLSYSKVGSTFRLWSPEAEAVRLHLYQSQNDPPVSTRSMNKDNSGGTWSLSINKDLAGTYYTFQVRSNGQWLSETPGPYAKATGINGKRGFVLDMSQTNPDNWEEDARPDLQSFNDIIIYELHLRDISIDPNSGIKFKGKFLGLSERGTQTSSGQSTGVDHLVELGVTHVHILPMFDFRSIDETKLDENPYNWGYEPQNYNVPEGSYSTDPGNPISRIKELKTMIQVLHNAGIRVIMDVVYNHTGFGEPGDDVFDSSAPGYYYRKNIDGTLSNASACGNETASERAMMRKFMIESVSYWATEYHMDGFRFDLMGIHDLQTMNEISTRLRNIDPTIFIYGEGWKAGSSPLADDQLALKSNVPKLKAVAAFSDEIRDGIKGSWHDWKSPGFVSGNSDRIEGVKFGIAGGVHHPQINYTAVHESDEAWAPNPDQCIVYVSCHDNHTLYDKLKIVNPESLEEDIIKQHILANTIVLTSQGIPFLHAGVDFVRTKQGVENSYNSPDSINMIDWNRKEKYSEVFTYYKQLIQMRKDHPAFRMKSQKMINDNLTFVNQEGNVIVYQLDGNPVNDRWGKILVAFNGDSTGFPLELPSGKWNVVLHAMEFLELPREEVELVQLDPYSAMILIQD